MIRSSIAKNSRLVNGSNFVGRIDDNNDHPRTWYYTSYNIIQGVPVLMIQTWRE